MFGVQVDLSASPEEDTQTRVQRALGYPLKQLSARARTTLRRLKRPRRRRETPIEPPTSDDAGGDGGTAQPPDETAGSPDAESTKNESTEQTEDASAAEGEAAIAGDRAVVARDALLEKLDEAGERLEVARTVRARRLFAGGHAFAQPFLPLLGIVSPDWDPDGGELIDRIHRLQPELPPPRGASLLAPAELDLLARAYNRHSRTRQAMNVLRLLGLGYEWDIVARVVDVEMNLVEMLWRHGTRHLLDPSFKLDKRYRDWLTKGWAHLGREGSNHRDRPENPLPSAPHLSG